VRLECPSLPPGLAKERISEGKHSLEEGANAYLTVSWMTSSLAPSINLLREHWGKGRPIEGREGEL